MVTHHLCARIQINVGIAEQRKRVICLFQHVLPHTSNYEVESILWRSFQEHQVAKFYDENYS